MISKNFLKALMNYDVFSLFLRFLLKSPGNLTGILESL